MLSRLSFTIHEGVSEIIRVTSHIGVGSKIDEKDLFRKVVA